MILIIEQKKNWFKFLIYPQCGLIYIVVSGLKYLEGGIQQYTPVGWLSGSVALVWIVVIFIKQLFGKSININVINNW